MITDEEMQRNLEANGMPPSVAADLVALYASLHSGALAQDYYRNKPGLTGKVKLEDFAKEFAAAF